jgi:predicted glycogen debranching enzyme
MRNPAADVGREWLEADGLGGFASGTTAGIRTRRYHALLLHAARPPGERRVLVNGCEVWVEHGGTRTALTSEAYVPDVVYPDGAGRIAAFTREPWPCWHYDLGDGTCVTHELLVPRGHAAVLLVWRATPGLAATLCVRPFLSGRDYHALHHENGAFDFATRVTADRLMWRPYGSLPAVVARSNGTWTQAPLWFRQFRYDVERARGLDWVEDLGSPGELRFDLGRGDALWLMAAEGHETVLGSEPLAEVAASVRDAELVRRTTVPALHRDPGPLDGLATAGEAYLVDGVRGPSIIAGYPWFTDWGRDTFIALRGLCLATGRLALARDILVGWSHALSEGMLPNRFPDAGSTPEYNAVDASLWYVVVVDELLAAAGDLVSAAGRTQLCATTDAILAGYAAGTRHGIRLDDDGLLRAGEPGVQLTWMDAKVGDWVVTPRIGKPVEVQALWLHALAGAATRDARWRDVLTRGKRSFAERFWDERHGRLYDVVDVDHRAGTADSTFRPNQIFAAGGLGTPLLAGARARRVVDVVEAHLWTPLGLRSLAPDEPGYAPHYGGDQRTRDGAYHQGAVWPWLLGPFVQAWVRVRGGTLEARREARRRFLVPLQAHLAEAGLGHVSEIADGAAPHAPRGCPFQAWSVGEALRLDRVVLVEPDRGG